MQQGKAVIVLKLHSMCTVSLTLLQESKWGWKCENRYYLILSTKLQYDNQTCNYRNAGIG